jgi:anti-sigma factor RsiW
MHLTQSDLDRYLARTLDRDGRARVDLHLDACPHCALAVEDVVLEPERWERRGILGRLTPVVPAAAPPTALRAEPAGLVRRAT